jgi:multidrug efflux system outer membrane protein
VRRRLSVSAIIIVMLGNLAVGQKKVYQPPSVQTPTVYRAEDATSQTGTPSFGDLKWFEVLKDERLQELLRTAIAQNYNVRQAVARIKAARAQLGLARADQFPNFVASGSLVTTRLPKDGSLGELANGTQRNISFGQVLLNLLNFEIDIWGRVKKIKNARNADLKASEEDRNTVLSVLVSTVATAYWLGRARSSTSSQRLCWSDSRQAWRSISRVRSYQSCLDSKAEKEVSGDAAVISSRISARPILLR